MKFKCKTEDIAHAFQLLVSVIPGRTPRPTLNNVKIETKENSLELSATDSEIALSYVIDGVAVEEPGVVSIPGNHMSSILRETFDAEVAFSAEGESCELQTADSVYRISGDDPHNFPFIPLIDEDVGSIELPVSVMRDAIRKTAFATSREKTRYALNGILTKISGNKLEMVSTDGKRLARISKELPQGIDGEISAIVPTKAMQLIERIGEGAGEGEKLQLSLKENIVQLRMPNITLCAKLVDGNFPNYEEVIPTDYTKRITLNCALLNSGMRRASLFTSEESRAVQFTLAGEILTLQSHSDVAGEAKIELKVEGNEHEIDVAFNPEFLLDVLRVTVSETLDIEFMDFNRPVLIKSEEGYVNVIMPISASP